MDPARSNLSDDDPDPDHEQSRPHYVAHGHFAGEVAAAIEVRAGLTPAATSTLGAFVDAPLFGEVDVHHSSSSPRIHGPLNLAAQLPPRARADRLVGIYWQHIHYVDVILDRERFFRNYETSYSRPNALLDLDLDVWLSTLNAIFAISVQRQESIPLQKRNEDGNRYFQRAIAVLHSDIIFWKPASLELVQCLILINQYLQCTKNPYKTWMTAGLAIQMARSVCFHPLDTALAKESTSDKWMRQRVWAGCVALDRCVSWALGRTAVSSLIPFPSQIDTMPLLGSCQQEGSYGLLLTRTLELYEIGNQIQLAQTQTRNNLAVKSGLLCLYQQDEYHAAVVHLDASLDKWEKSLPSDWKVQSLQGIVDRTSRAERYLLHLRFLHHRIVLYRPMLARFYSMKSHTETAEATSNPPNLSDRVLRECAGMCVEAAQKVTSLIMETLVPNEPIGLLPWWHRLYFLHIAGVNFLAAMFTSDLFTESVSQSWHTFLSAFRAHAHLCTPVHQVVWTFETLSKRILETRYPNLDGGNDSAPEAVAPGLSLDDIFQDVGFDFDNFLFGTEELFGDQR